MSYSSESDLVSTMRALVKLRHENDVKEKQLDKLKQENKEMIKSLEQEMKNMGFLNFEKDMLEDHQTVNRLSAMIKRQGQQVMVDSLLKLSAALDARNTNM